MRIHSFLAAAAMLSASLAAHANSIVFDSVNNGTYSYGLQETIPTTYLSGATVIFSGLYGVTGATSAYGFSTTFTSTSVTFTQNAFYSIYFGDLNSSDVFEITSTSGVSGLALYASVSSPAFSGSVTGPVAPLASSVTPEPSSFALLGTGLLGVAGVVRKRLAV